MGILFFVLFFYNKERVKVGGLINFKFINNDDKWVLSEENI